MVWPDRSEKPLELLMEIDLEIVSRKLSGDRSIVLQAITRGLCVDGS
jgi:hypothetical protein